MNKLKISLSVLLVVFILAGIQFFMPSKVSAGNRIEFPNLQHSDDDVITWDRISNNVNGYIYTSIRDCDTGEPAGGTSGHSSLLTKVSIQEEFKSNVQLEPGTYKFVIYATALNGDEYYYECTYVYDYHILNDVENLSFDGEKLTWEFNDPEVDPEAIIKYNVSVSVYDENNNEVLPLEFKNLTSTELPAESFLSNGTFDYWISVYARSSDPRYQISGFTSISLDEYTASEINGVSGLTEKDGLISWDAFPGATSYSVSFKYKMRSNSSRSESLDTRNTDYFMPWHLRNINIEQDIRVFVTAYDENDHQLCLYNSIVYHYPGNDEIKYPLYIAGHQLSSHDNLADLFDWYADGRLKFISSENKLVFVDFDNTKKGDYSSLTEPLFYSPSAIQAEGTANLTANTELFKSDSYVVFSDGCNISGRSDRSAVVAANIVIQGGQVDFTSDDGDTMSASNGITVANKTASVSLETSGDSSVAMKTDILRLGYNKIIEPVNGKFDDGKKTICDADGTPARKVKLIHFEPTPTATATATPTCTATPTATAKPKPTAAPTAKPAVTQKPSADPASNPTAKPSTVSLTLDKKTASVICGKDLALEATLKGSSSKIAWESSDRKIATVDANGKVTAKMAGTVTVTATAAGKTATCTVTVLYKDVTDSKDFWYAPTNYLTAKGVVKGYDNQTKFKPANKCTRAQMVTFIWRLQGEPKPKTSKCKFKDVKKTDYFYKACIWGNENHIVEGYKDGTFGPQIVCARKHAVTFLWRLAGKPKPTSTKNKFKDVKKSDYFYTATIWASEKKILAGYSDGTFRPNGDCLRRQMVTFLYKYDKSINTKK